MNVRVIADPRGRLLWAFPSLPGAVHDINEAARTRGTVRVPHWERRETPSAGQQAVNRSPAKIRALVEQAVATLTT
ncbi:hypothetical protein SUDANB176_00215 [Streptomyces sp. enrichment culture]